MNRLPVQNLLFALCALTIITLPWYASGKSAFSLLLLEISGGLLLLLLSVSHTRHRYYGLGFFIWLFLAFLILTTSFYLIPLSIEQWSELPGRLRFFPAFEWLKDKSIHTYISASLVPERTISSLVSLIALISLFIATAIQTNQMKKKLIILIIFIAAIQGIIGVIQFSTKLEHWYFFEVTGHSNAVGTYLNRDHFSALMYMMLPITLALISNHFNQLSSGSSRNQYNIIQLFGLALLVILFVCAALFTGSRAGITLTILSMILAIFMFALPVGGWKNAGIVATIFLLSTTAAMSIGIISALNRLIAINPFEDARWDFFKQAIVGIKAFWPVGTGLGTFQEVYATMQPVTQGNFINHVHNDYLELLFEMGAIGALILLMALIIYIKTWVSLRELQWTENKFIRVASGISIFLLLLHELLDFNLHTPANQIVFVVLCAIFISNSKRVA